MRNKYIAGLWCIIIFTAATAFKHHDSGTHRYVGKTAYVILDTTDFYLYGRYEPVEVNRGKGTIMQYDYFFSKDAGSMIEPLTLTNIENLFADNIRFRYALEAHFAKETI